MVAADVNLQVWLDTVPGTHPAMVVPYVKSQTDSQIQYRLTVVKRGLGGSSNIGQSGQVQAQAGRPTELSRFSLNLGAHDECQIELILISNNQPAGTYRFECPR